MRLHAVNKFMDILSDTVSDTVQIGLLGDIITRKNINLVNITLQHTWLLTKRTE